MRSKRNSNAPWRRALSGRVALLNVLVLMLVSCATSTAVDSYCLVAKPIYFADTDTEETIRQILRENAKYDELCST